MHKHIHTLTHTYKHIHTLTHTHARTRAQTHKHTHTKPDACTVPWSVCKGERVGVTWLHFPSAMVNRLQGSLVRLGSPPQLLLSCSVNRDHPCSVNKGRVCRSILISPHERRFSVAEQVIQQILKPDWVFAQPCSDFYSTEDRYVNEFHVTN